MTRQTVRRLQTMVDAGLIGYRELHPWAESTLLSLETPPKWLCDLAMIESSPQISKALGEYVWSEPFESVDQAELEDEHLSCLYLRYERHELSWATFLDLAGRYADNTNGAWQCEEFFEFLKQLQDADFSQAIERRQREVIAGKLLEAIERIRREYEDLRMHRRVR